ncbi:MAG: hypothetical protein AB7E72_08295 [Lysobacterales bacterium]
MLSLPAIVLLLSLGASGDIYRCADSNGALSYQDKPCASGASARLAASGSDAAATQRALQQWLDQHRDRAAASPRPAAAPARVPLTFGGPVSEAQLAMCSERFLGCAHGQAEVMDTCVARLPRCSAKVGSGCCPQACVSRYQALRQAGKPLALSVKLALLDPDAPACGVFRKD